MTKPVVKTLQQLGAARAPVPVAMPRFRKQRKATAKSKRLSEVVLRVLTRVLGDTGDFGVFVTEGGARLARVGSGYFNTLERNKRVTLVGIYDSAAKVADVTEDLSEFYSDEVA